MVKSRSVVRQPCVYVIAARDGRVKVGVSIIVARRLAELIAQEGEPLTIFAQANAPTMRLAYRIEKEAHGRLAERCIEGEWFNVTRHHAVRVLRESEAAITPPLGMAAEVAIGERVNASAQDLAAFITAARRQAGWRMEDLAGRAKVSLSSIKNIERGATDPRSSTLRSIYKALREAGISFG